DLHALPARTDEAGELPEPIAVDRFTRSDSAFSIEALRERPRELVGHVLRDDDARQARRRDLGEDLEERARSTRRARDRDDVLRRDVRRRGAHRRRVRIRRATAIRRPRADWCLARDGRRRDVARAKLPNEEDLLQDLLA